MKEDFREDFTETLRRGGEALDEHGFGLEGYKVYLVNPKGTNLDGSGATPDEALDNFMDKINPNWPNFIRFQGHELEDMINGELENPESIVYRSLEGIVEVDEPTTTEFREGEDTEIYNAQIRYIPSFPNDYWRIDTLDTKSPYTRTNAAVYAENIVEALEDEGLNAEKGNID